MKTFMVAGKDGQKTIEAEQLGTFALYIENIQFRFVVTKLNNAISVTHRKSGFRLCDVPYMAVAAAVNDYALAGKAELQKRVSRVGEARVASKLRECEL